MIWSIEENHHVNVNNGWQQHIQGKTPWAKLVRLTVCVAKKLHYQKRGVFCDVMYLIQYQGTNLLQKTMGSKIFIEE